MRIENEEEILGTEIEIELSKPTDFVRVFVPYAESVKCAINILTTWVNDKGKVCERRFVELSPDLTVAVSRISSVRAVE